MNQSFKSCEELATALQTRLSKRYDPTIADLLSQEKAILVEFGHLFPLPSSSDEDAWEFLTPARIAERFGIRWVIQDEDLALLDNVLDGLKSTAGGAALDYVFGGVAMPLMTLVTIVGNLFSFFCKIRKKGVLLSDMQFRILRALKSSEAGMTVEEIKDQLVRTDSGVQRDMIEATLNQLAKLRREDGKVVTLANQDGTGRWSAAGV